MTAQAKITRGGSAEWCPTCKINVMPLAKGADGNPKSWWWVCPECKKPLPEVPA